MPRSMIFLSVAFLAATSCTSAGPDLMCGTPDALARCVSPTLPEAHYVAQANAYFDSYDADADPESRPDYAETVARWEWPPWLKLTGFGAEAIEAADAIVLAVTPSTIPNRDCRFFDEQPFARCRVSFEYSAGSCAIYEEFSFDHDGNVIFIEAWSDREGLLPTDDPDDPWAEGRNVRRMSTIVPGVGSPEGVIDPFSEGMETAAAANEDVADFHWRAQDFWAAWFIEVRETGTGGGEEGIYGEGCGWE